MIQKENKFPFLFLQHLKLTIGIFFQQYFLFKMSGPDQVIEICALQYQGVRNQEQRKQVYIDMLSLIFFNLFFSFFGPPCNHLDFKALWHCLGERVPLLLLG